MSDKRLPPSTKSPTDIARDTFKRLAIERIAPTPEAYQKAYNEIAGIPDASEIKNTQPEMPTPSEAENLLTTFANHLQKSSGDLINFGHRLQRSLSSKNWEEYAKVLRELADKTLNKVNPNLSNSISLVDPPPANATSATRVSLVDDFDPSHSKETHLKDALFRTLGMALSSLLKEKPTLATESEAIADKLKFAVSEPEFKQVASRVKQLCFQIELVGGDTAEQQELLLRLFSLLLNNVHDLLEEDNWLRGQIIVIQNLIAGPIDHRLLQEATRSLKDVIYKQGTLKSSLDDSRSSVKNMMATFIDRLDVMANTTSAYQFKIDEFSQQIRETRDALAVEKIILAILNETQTIHSETMRSHQIMLAAQKEVKEAETRIKELEAKLEEMSELVREDQLTGSLNRRGLDEIFEREADRSDRRNSPLCIAMLDLDNFKKLNDTHGHASGDEALIHVVRIVKQTLRSIDVIARYGGEEFIILMPETTLEEAARAMTRVQRELTTHFFTVDDKRIFITFSAGIALRGAKEDQNTLIKRADQAMYEAKRSGKNRVVIAP